MNVKDNTIWIVVVIVIAIVAIIIALSVATDNNSGVVSVGEYGDDSILQNNVKIEEGVSIDITRSDADNSLVIGLEEAWRAEHLNMDSFRVGSTPPTVATRDGFIGWEFDADAESMKLTWGVPSDWDEVTEPYFVLMCVLLNNETNGDDIDWDIAAYNSAIFDDIDDSTAHNVDLNFDIGTYSAAGQLIPVYCEMTCDLSPRDIVSIDISRSSDIGTAGYAADVMVIDAFVYYHADSLGQTDINLPS